MGKRFGKRKSLQERFDDRMQKRAEQFERNAAYFRGRQWITMPNPDEEAKAAGLVRLKFGANAYVTCKPGSELAIFLTVVNQPLAVNQAVRLDCIPSSNGILEDPDGAPYPLRSDGSIDLVPGRSYVIDQVIVKSPAAPSGEELTSFYQATYFDEVVRMEREDWAAAAEYLGEAPDRASTIANVNQALKEAWEPEKMAEAFQPSQAQIDYMRRRDPARPMPSIGAYMKVIQAALYQFAGIEVAGPTVAKMETQFVDWLQQDDERLRRYARGDNGLCLEFLTGWLVDLQGAIVESLPVLRAVVNAPEPEPKKVELKGRRQMYLD